MTIHKQHINLIFHLLVWSVILLLPYFVGSAEDHYKIGLMPGFAFTAFGVLHMLIFYINACYLAPVFLNLRRWWLYIPFAALLLLLSFILKFIILKTGYPYLLQNHAIYRFAFAPSVGVLLISIVYRKVTDRIYFEKKQKEREAAMLMPELKLLRAQISPHFLFNVMTNLVSLARKRSDLLEPALITLSDFMRYMVYDTQGKKVSLLKETTHLKNYISLQKMRFGNEFVIEDDIEEADDHYLIEPMLLIPFVENAFKHGAAQDTDARILIRLKVDDNRLFFTVQNSSPLPQSNAGYEHSGVGLKNVIARLELLYPQKHALKITREQHTFHVQLKLEL